jgi:hypothetical protein
MTISGTSPYDAPSTLSMSAFGHSTASPLATTRIEPAYLRTYDATAGDFSATNANGVGAMFTKLDDPAYH